MFWLTLEADELVFPLVFFFSLFTLVLEIPKRPSLNSYSLPKPCREKETFFDGVSLLQIGSLGSLMVVVHRLVLVVQK